MALLSSTPLLAALFVAAGAVVWVAGTRLSSSTDAIADRFGLGEALGGVILLAFATNLPEVAITASAAFSGHVDLAVGNILGGIAIQTVVLAALDLARPEPLTSRTFTLQPLLEAVLVVGVLSVAVMGTALPKNLLLFRVAPEDIAVLLAWLTGLWLIQHARGGLPWRLQQPSQTPKTANRGEGHQRPLLVFGVAALATLVAGAVLAQTGDAIAHKLNLTGAVFGATVLAAVTSLPELSTGLAAVKIGDNELAMSDIFGGNAFLPVLFLFASLLSGNPALTTAGKSDVYLALLGILVTVPYVFGLLFRPRRQVLRMGLDSVAVIAIYAVGVAGLALVH